MLNQTYKQCYYIQHMSTPAEVISSHPDNIPKFDILVSQLEKKDQKVIPLSTHHNVGERKSRVGELIRDLRKNESVDNSTSEPEDIAFTPDSISSFFDKITTQPTDPERIFGQPGGVSKEKQNINEFDDIETISKEVAEKRTAYASLFSAWKRKNTENKSWIQKNVFAPLGLDKQTPLVTKSAELLEARREYDASEKKIKEYLIRRGDIVIGTEKRIKPGQMLDLKEEEVKIIKSVKECLIEQEERELTLLQRKMLETLPKHEKSIVENGFKKWGNLPLLVRVSLTSALFTALGVAFGDIGLDTATTQAAFRTGRAVIGAVGAQVVGKYVDSIHKKRNEKTQQKIDDEYANAVIEHFTTQATEDNPRGMDERSSEDKLLEFQKIKEKHDELRENLEYVKNRQKVSTGAAMIVAGAGLNIGMSGAQAHFAPEVPQSTGVLRSLREKMFGDKDVDAGTHSSGIKERVSVDVKYDSFEPYVVEANDAIKSISVELNPKGFIPTLSEIRTDIIDRYGIHDIPRQFQYLVETPTVTLAQELGLYDAQHHLSGFGLKGDRLSVNLGNGKLYYEQAGNIRIIDSDHPFNRTGGNMLREDGTVVRGQKMEINKPIENIQNLDGAEVTSRLIEEENPIEHIVHLKNQPVSPNISGAIDDNTIAVLPEIYNRMQSESGKSKIVTTSENSSAKIESRAGEVLVEVPFKDGDLTIVEGNNEGEIRVILDKKEIAGGIMRKGKYTVALGDDIPRHSHWWEAHTVYENALEKVKPFIKKLQKSKKIA